MQRYLFAVAFFLSISAVLPAGRAQAPAADSADKNYKLTMDKVKAYDLALGKMAKILASDAGLRNEMQAAVKKTGLDGFFDVLAHSPKTQPIYKSSGLTAHEFLLIPMCVQIVASAHNNPAQASVMAAMTNKENLEFYEKNKADLDRMMNKWQQEMSAEGGR
jgi:hypothetical protein